MLFYMIIGLIILQRLAELMIARRNETKLKALGGYEVGMSHYKMIVVLHALFFFSLFLEGHFFRDMLLFGWQALFFLFLALQIVRIWVIRSLGVFWNTKIIILPGASPVVKGPYRWIRHPNYLIVILELLILPLMFQAYVTAFCFTVVNMYLLLKIRIPEEEQALLKETNYQDALGNKKRFLP